MRSLSKLLFLLPLFLLVAAAKLGAQTPDFPPVAELTPDNIFESLIDPIFGALVILFGYLSALIPGVKKIEPFYRVLAFAAVAGLGFYQFGVGFWKVAFTYFIATGLYDTFLKKLFPTRRLETSA